jgi:hypothetical protein
VGKGGLVSPFFFAIRGVCFDPNVPWPVCAQSGFSTKRLAKEI